MTFKYGLPSVLIILFVVLIYLGGLPNDLHKLTLVDTQERVTDYKDYLNEVTGDHPAHSRDYFFVGSYGGGLKANLWNLLLFDELQKKSDEKFLKRTLVLSGVSGGAVGIGNYSALLYNSQDSLEMAQRIDAIGKSNVLSNEITYLLGADWVREFLPFFKYHGRDRSYKSMKEHARLTGMDLDEYNKVSFTDYWNRIYEDQKHKFPILIMNSTEVGGRQGVATSVRLPKDAIPGANVMNLYERDESGDSISHPKNKIYVTDTISTITYFGAVSTTNRFPFFSPTAKIHRKGSFLDGGYFENSGMLSAYEIYDAVAGDPTKDYHGLIRPVFINIINSEDYYVQEKIREWGFKAVNSNDTGEISAILGTLASLDKLTGYMHGKLEARDSDSVVKIMMPHKISYGKVKDLLNADVDDPLGLMHCIDVHNEMIDNALIESRSYEKDIWGVIEPPMARLLGKPAVEYQKAMVSCHPEVIKRIEGIVNDYLVPKESAINKDQEINEKKQIIDSVLFERSLEGEFGADPESAKVSDSLKAEDQ